MPLTFLPAPGGSGAATVRGTTAGFLNDGEDICGSAGADLYCTFTLTQRQRVQVVLEASFGASVSLRAGCTTTPLVCDRSASPTNLVVEANDLAPGSYSVIVDSANGTSQGSFLLRVNLSAPVSTVGESCSQPIALDLSTGSASATGTTRGFLSNSDSSCGSSAPDVYYSFQLTQPRRVTASLASSGWTGGLRLLSAACAPDNSIPCDWQNGTATVEVRELPVGVYLLLVDGYTAGESGSYVLTVNTAPPLPTAGDTCATATPLFFAGSPLRAVVSDTTSGYRNNISSLSCTSAASDVFYSFTLTTPQRLSAVLNATWSAGLTLLRTCSSAVGVCQSTILNNTPAVLEVNQLPVGQYTLVVDGYTDSRRGPFTLTVTLSP